MKFQKVGEKLFDLIVKTSEINHEKELVRYFL